MVEVGDYIKARWPGESDLVEFPIEWIREDEDGILCVVFGRDGLVGAEAISELELDNDGVWTVAD